MEREDTTKRMTAGDITGCIASAVAVQRFRKPLVDYLISGLEEKDKWVRFMAAEMLGAVGDSRAVSSLKPLMADRDQDLRAVSAIALDMIGNSYAPVTTPWSGCQDCIIRFIADEALKKLKNTEQ